jgi:DNA-binding NarL/FixJ family response regulator
LSQWFQQTGVLKMPADMIRIFVAEDNATMRAILKAALWANSEAEIVGEAADGSSAVQGIASLKPDVALIDISLPQLNGIEVTNRAKNLHRDLKVLIITGDDSPISVANSFAAGADGYYLKKNTDQLFKAVQKVHAGGHWLDPAIASMLLKSCVYSAAELPLASDAPEGKPAQTSTSTQFATQLSSNARQRDLRFVTAIGAHSPLSILMMHAAELESQDNDPLTEAVLLGELALAEKFFGPKSPDLASVATQLADFYFERKKYTRAQTFYFIALEIRFGNFRSDDQEPKSVPDNHDRAESSWHRYWSGSSTERPDDSELSAEIRAKISWLRRVLGKHELVH